MARYTGPKNRLARAHKINLWLKTKTEKVEKRLAIIPGQHGQKGRRGKLSDYGIQLAEKQKVKRIYGILERQFSNYYKLARKDPEATGTRLLQLLELRLDNIIYRLNLAPTRTSARQFVSHGHILVNGEKLDIPSYQVKIGDVISISSKIQENPDVKKLINDKKLATPKWLDKKAIVGKLLREPERAELDADINEQLIVEFYSR